MKIHARNKLLNKYNLNICINLELMPSKAGSTSVETMGEI